jgi:hypothetical protein
MVLCDTTLCLATNSPDRPALAIPASEIATSGRFHTLTEGGGLRQWVSRTMGTYTAPTIAALSGLLTHKGPALLAVLYSNGVLSVWLPTRGALRPMCQLNVAPTPTTGEGGPVTMTGLCAIMNQSMNAAHQGRMNGAVQVAR